MELTKAIQGFYLSRSADGYSPETLKMYRWALSRFCEQVGPKDLGDLTPLDLETFWNWIRTEYKPNRSGGGDDPLTNRSLENVWISLRSFFGWAESSLDLAKRPDLKIKRPRFRPAEIQPFTQDEVTRMLAACERTTPAKTDRREAFTMPRTSAERDTALILVLLDTGLRVSECARLKIRDVDPITGQVFVIPYGSGQKTKSRAVYLGKAAKHAVWKYLASRKDDPKPTDTLFISGLGKPMDRGTIRHLLINIGIRAKVPGAHPHRFRHTFAVEYLRNGGDVFTLQRMLGHSTLDMVKTYIQLAETDSAETHKKASPADRWKL